MVQVVSVLSRRVHYLPKYYHSAVKFLRAPACESRVLRKYSSLMEEDLANWKGCERPHRCVMEGRYVRLEPLDPQKHGDELYEASSGEGVDWRLKYLWEVPISRDEFQKWMESVYLKDDPIFYAVIDKKTGKVGGRQTFLRIEEAHGVVEIGHIMWGRLISRTPAATEALYLFAKHVFDDLGYRRFEWKCHHANERSRRAAHRFGFKLEGIFRKHFVMKGENRDTAWFAILNDEWPAIKIAMEKWLDPSNFDEKGVQKKRLEEIRGES